MNDMNIHHIKSVVVTQAKEKKSREIVFFKFWIHTYDATGFMRELKKIKDKYNIRE